jgi:hypothetical protein
VTSSEVRGSQFVSQVIWGSCISFHSFHSAFQTLIVISCSNPAVYSGSKVRLGAPGPISFASDHLLHFPRVLCLGVPFFFHSFLPVMSYYPPYSGAPGYPPPQPSYPPQQYPYALSLSGFVHETNQLLSQPYASPATASIRWLSWPVVPPAATSATPESLRLQPFAPAASAALWIPRPASRLQCML